MGVARAGYFSPTVFARGPSAVGGTVSDAGGYRSHTFTADGTLIVVGGYLTCDVLVVAAGGGAAGGAANDYRGGGGGAGGMLTATNHVVIPGAYSLTVGEGVTLAQGEDSVFGPFVAKGGGCTNPSHDKSALPGGSGGGGHCYSRSGVGGGESDRQILGGAGTYMQGYSGGRGYNDMGSQGGLAGGGGGGAGGAGATAGGSGGGAGGSGVSWNGTTYAAGGRGGGSGHYNSPGTANTGNGALGGQPNGGLAGEVPVAGGSGIIIIRYAI